MRHLSPPTLRRLRDAEDELRRIGLGTAATLLHDLRAAPQSRAEAAEAWVDAQIRLLVTAESAAQLGPGAVFRLRPNAGVVIGWVSSWHVAVGRTD